MKILVISSAAVPSPAPEYGGLEMIAAWFSKCAAEKGHEVTLISAKGSPWSVKSPHPNLEVLETVEPTWQDEAAHFNEYKDLILQEYCDSDTIVWDNTWSMYVYVIPYKMKKKCNIVHTHHGLYAPTSAPPVKYPCLVGVSGPHSDLISMRSGVPCRTVYNGIPGIAKENEQHNDGFLLSLNRMSKEKGIIDSIDVALQTRTPIKVVGDDIHTYDPEYNRRVWEKCRDNPHLVEYLGLVDNDTKNDLLKNCKGVIGLPRADWLEAFGLWAVEAAAHGKPVIGTKNGGLLNIVQHGKTGFLAGTKDEARNYVSRLDEIKPENCRARADEFSVEKMTDSYLALFDGIVSRQDRW